MKNAQKILAACTCVAGFALGSAAIAPEAMADQGYYGGVGVSTDFYHTKQGDENKSEVIGRAYLGWENALEDLNGTSYYAEIGLNHSLYDDTEKTYADIKVGFAVPVDENASLLARVSHKLGPVDEGKIKTSTYFGIEIAF